MENRVLEVFYGADGKPYKDQERSVLFPVVGNEYQGANDFTHIRFYYQRLCGEDNTLVAVFKNAKGQLGCKPLSNSNDSTRNEKYALLPISDFLTQYKGDIYIALQCYRGDADAITWDSDNNMWVLNTQVPTIRSTANIKMSVNYAPLIVGGGEEELITIQVLLSYIAEKSNIDDVVIVVGDISQEDLSGYDEGQLFYDKTTDAYYRKKATSPYYELVNNGKGVLGASRLLCRLTEDNATIERALSICGSSMFIYNPNGKDYLYFVTEQVSGSTAVAFDIETRRTFIRSGMQDSDTLASVINTTYEADLDLNNVYVKTKGVKIGDIYHTIELISGDLVIGGGSGDIWLQPAGTSKYITSRGEGDAYKVEQYEIANADFVLDQCLDISNMPTLDELALSYASRPNSVLKFGNSIYRHAYEDNTYIYYKCDDDEHSTNLSGYDTYTLNSFIRIKKSDGQVDRGQLSFNFYNKTQSEGKFATNFTASLDTTTYVITFTLKNANGVALATQTIDLPLESIVTSMTYYDEYTYGGTTYHNVLVIVLATTSVPTIVPVGSLISGLEHEALVEVSDISTPLTASQLALMEYPNAMITYGNDVYLKAEDNGTYITLSVPYISLTTNSGHEEATRKFIVVTKSSGAMALTSDTTSFYDKSQADSLLGEKADASSVVTDSDIETLGGAVTRIRKGNTWNEVAQEVNMSTTPKVVQSVADLPADNDGYLYVVLDNGYLYSWDEENQEWAQQYQYTSDLLTITEVEVGDDDYSYIEDKTNDNRPIQVASARKDANGDVIDETYAKISDLETIDERLDNHDTDIAKLKKDVDYALKYPLLYGTPTTDTEEEVGLTTSQLPATTLPKGLVNYVGGMSKKVNQYITNGNFENTSNWSVNGGSASVSNNVYSFVGTPNATIWQVYQSVPAVANHKYLFAYVGKSSQATPVDLSYGTSVIETFSFTTTWKTFYKIFTYTYTSSNLNLLRKAGLESSVTIDIKNALLIDLTDIYGAGNEPTSTDDPRIQWLIHYLTDNPQYNEGSIVNAPVEKLSSKGFNIWDEEWELGDINAENGNKTSGSRVISKNICAIMPDGTYYCDYTKVLTIFFYDKNQAYIGYANPSAQGIVVAPTNAYYFNFRCATSYGTTYNHDICINLSGAMNGTYLPYQAPSNYPVPAEVQALDGYGLGIDDTLYNYIDFENKKFVKKVARVDLGTLTWTRDTSYGTNAIFYCETINEMKANLNLCCVMSKYSPFGSTTRANVANNAPNLSYAQNTSNKCVLVRDDNYTDANTFKTAMNGVYLYFELAEPVEIDISEYLDRDFPNENLIDTYQGGEVEFENDNDMGVPYSLTYQYKVE